MLSSSSSASWLAWFSKCGGQPASVFSGLLPCRGYSGFSWPHFIRWVARPGGGRPKQPSPGSAPPPPPRPDTQEAAGSSPAQSTAACSACACCFGRERKIRCGANARPGVYGPREERGEREARRVRRSGGRNTPPDPQPPTPSCPAAHAQGRARTGSTLAEKRSAARPTCVPARRVCPPEKKERRRGTKQRADRLGPSGRTGAGTGTGAGTKAAWRGAARFTVGGVICTSPIIL